MAWTDGMPGRNFGTSPLDDRDLPQYSERDLERHLDLHGERIACAILARVKGTSGDEAARIARSTR